MKKQALGKTFHTRSKIGVPTAVDYACICLELAQAKEEQAEEQDIDVRTESQETIKETS